MMRICHYCRGKLYQVIDGDKMKYFCPNCGHLEYHKLEEENEGFEIDSLGDLLDYLVNEEDCDG